MKVREKLRQMGIEINDANFADILKVIAESLPPPKPEPVYEYQWLMKNHVDGTVFVTSQFFKSLRSLRSMGNHIEILERLDKYKREAK